MWVLLLLPKAHDNVYSDRTLFYYYILFSGTGGTLIIEEKTNASVYLKKTSPHVPGNDRIVPRAGRGFVQI